MTRPVRAARAIATFDSGPAMLGAVARFLHGRDVPAAGMLPDPVARLAEPVAPLLNRLPAAVRQQLYARSGGFETIRPELLGRVRAEPIARWMTAQVPRRRYPAVVVGSASGALAHLCAALGVPFLPQTFLVALRQPGRHVDDIAADVAHAAPAARRLLEANPELELHQMQDPNQDRLMLSRITYLRLKWQRLPQAFHAFLRDTLAPGGTVIVADCRLAWPTTRIGERHVFQLGGLGGVPPEEYQTGSERISAYLARHGSPWRRWAPPPPDAERPEAEWGFAPALLDDVRRVARAEGWRVARLAFPEPDDLSGPVAELHRRWYADLGRPAERLLVSSFALLDPWWTLRTGSVPFWLEFSVEPSAVKLERHLAERSYEEIHVAAFPHGIESVGFAPAHRWQALAARARRRGGLLGIDPEAFPRDLAAYLRFRAALRALPDRVPLPDPLPLDRAAEVLAAQPGIGWEVYRDRA